jgi:hypothetical protein
MLFLISVSFPLPSVPYSSKFQRLLLYQLFYTVPCFSVHSSYFKLVGSKDKRGRTLNERYVNDLGNGKNL